MLWIVTSNASHEIVSCNIHKKESLYQLWVERSNGKNLKIEEHKNIDRIKDIKEAIDYAIEKKHKVLRLE